jgi:hypothetical protein
MCGLLLALLCVLPVGAETVCESGCMVAVGEPFVAFAEHDPGVSGYALYVNEQPSGIAPVLANGFVEFHHPGFSTVANVTLVIYAHAGTPTQFQYTDAMSLSVTRRKLKVRRLVAGVF